MNDIQENRHQNSRNPDIGYQERTADRMSDYSSQEWVIAWVHLTETLGFGLVEVRTVANDLQPLEPERLNLTVVLEVVFERREIAGRNAWP